MKLDKGTAGAVRIATVVAALVFMLQSAVAFAAPPVQRDIFGNVLCAPGSTRMPGAEHMSDGCLLTCSAAFQASGSLPPETEWPAFAHEAGSGLPLPAEAGVVLRERRTPANPRAPPFHALS